MKTFLQKKIKNIVLIAVFSLFVSNVFALTIYVSASSHKKHLKRTFSSQAMDNKVSARNKVLQKNGKSAIVMDLAAMQNIYEIADIEYNFTEDETEFTMDIGDADLENAQTWVMPDIDFPYYCIGENKDVAQSPYYSTFSEATHLKQYDYSEQNEQFYEYYKFAADKIEIIGLVDVINENPEIIPVTYLVAPLPLNIDTDFETSAEYTLNGETYHYEQYIYTEGFGTLETPEGTFNCLKLANDYYEDVYVDGNLVESYATFVYTFYCENGYRLDVYLDPEVEVFTGVVNCDYAQVEIPTTSTSVEEISLKADFCYPNPATDILNFQEIGNYQIYNSIGVMILNLKNIQNTDISNLNSGLYFIKSENGKIQKIIINN